MVKNGNVNSVLVSRVIWNIIIIFNFSLKLSRTFSLEEGEGLGEVARSRGGCGNLAWVSGLPKGLGERRFSSFLFSPRNAWELRLVGTLRRQGALSIMVCLALISHFSFAFFFLLLRYAGLFFLVLLAVVAFPLALSTQPIFKPVRLSPIIYCLQTFSIMNT